MTEIKSYNKNTEKGDNSSLKRIGNLIKEARLSRDQSIEELAFLLRIGEHQLKAIEDGDEENLPEEVFIRAMVRRISDKLKLDTKYIMNEFNNIQEIEIEEIIEKGPQKTEITQKFKRKNFLGFGVFLILSGLIGLIASSLVLNLLSDSVQNQSPKLEILEED